MRHVKQPDVFADGFVLVQNPFKLHRHLKTRKVDELSAVFLQNFTIRCTFHNLLLPKRKKYKNYHVWSQIATQLYLLCRSF